MADRYTLSFLELHIKDGKKMILFPKDAMAIMNNQAAKIAELRAEKAERDSWRSFREDTPELDHTITFEAKTNWFEEPILVRFEKRNGYVIYDRWESTDVTCHKYRLFDLCCWRPLGWDKPKEQSHE